MHAGPPQFGPLSRRDWLAALLLAGLAVAVFVPALRCDFVNYDDPEYVVANPHVTEGPTAAGIRWAFTTSYMGNWHPLTWLSLQLDASLWKLDPRGYHLTSVLLHAANTALLFLALRTLTGAFWRSLAVVVLFSVHPLRTEAVAWISERKGVLSIFFGLLALWAYAGYARSPRPSRYLLVMLALALSLMSKPALVTFPFLALVLDWWPLGRAVAFADWRRLAVEKIPLLALVLAFSVVAYWTQSGSGALGDSEMFPLTVRVKNAIVGYVMYLYLTVYPVDLAILYPHPWARNPGHALPLDQVGGSLLLLCLFTACAIAMRKRASYLLAGWLWYLGTLVPVIGLVQVGGAAYADRYVYFPQIGLLIAICWSAADVAARRPALAYAAGIAAAVALTVGTLRQLDTWRDSVTLWQNDIHIVGKYPKALNNLGEAYASKGQDDEAAARFREALEHDANDGMAHANLGNVAFRKGRMDDAAAEFEAACRLAPGSSQAFSSFGMVELLRQKIDHAIALYHEALRLEPESAAAHTGLGYALLMGKRRDDGLAHLREASRCDPRYVLAYVFLGKALEERGDIDGAAEQFEQAARVKPTEALYWVDLGRIRQRQGRTEEATRCLKRAAELNPRFSFAARTAGSPERSTP
jgi:protein O-mannosyl-transferase